MAGTVRDKRFVKKLLRLLEDKKVQDAAAYDLKPINPFVDYTVVATCANPAQINALIGAVNEAAKEAKAEGSPDSGWVIVDVGRVILHLQSPQKREFYRLDQLWENCRLEV